MFESIATLLSQDKIQCLQCGKRFKILKRHIKIEHNMSEEQYRFKFRIPTDQLLVAQDYAKAKLRFLEEKNEVPVYEPITRTPSE